ncbi:cupin domain-containing protein [Streptomyces sp. NBC_01551]|uniref:JmjC domain-containing protein n=1 Tax=Streptomyces sp. NBC_01551 TaxID=2975876 RepID=UPI00225A3DF1|nr:cupin domain-containing protein [Streptomyces sp. NBC_01551]MCX4529317.1 cupin domain-containing protein [Streptomyces sp. NBC_01551]
MTSHSVHRLDEVDRLAIREGGLPDDLVSLIDTANSAAVERAAARLRPLLGDTVVTVLERPCEAPAFGSAGNDFGRLPGRTKFERWLTAEPRLVAGPGTGANADMELRDADGKLPGERFGNRLEPDSDTFQMDIHRVRRALNEGVTLGIRQFDRWSPALASLMDDIVAVSGADVFTKLFISAGATSVTGWHSDRQDVIALMLWGSKRFQLGDWDTPEGGPASRIVLDEVLKPGDCLLFPEGHPHQAVPLGDDSGLLSIALLRRHNWISRDQVPTHLGVSEFPPSEVTYRRLLRSRLPLATESPHLADSTQLRTRIPGGVELLGSTPDGQVAFAAAGGVFAASPDTTALLASVHASFPVTLGEVPLSGDPEAAAQQTRSLVEMGLVITTP